MTLDSRQRQFLQDLLKSEGTVRRTSAVALHFHEHHRIGRLLGRQVEFDDADRESARQLLSAHGLPLTALGPGAARAEAAQYPGMSEKSGTRAPSADSVAIKAVGDLVLDAHRVTAPARGYLVWRVEDVCRIPADLLLVVENLETFRDLEEYRWINFQRHRRVLVIFRGDATRSAGDTLDVLRRRTEPVWAFMDFDPAGLGMAATVPRLEQLVLPSEKWLRERAHGPRAVQLYEDSVGQWSPLLSACSQPGVRAAWALLQGLRAGVAQESMASAV